MSRLVLIPLTMMAVTACGGGGGDSEGGGGAPDIAAPQELSASSRLNSATLSWQPVDGANTYNLYYATDPGVEPSNYGAFDGGTLVQDVVSPHTVDGLSAEPVYHFITTAVAGSESSASNEAKAVPRYDERGDVVIDAVNDLEWRRCVHGQSWDADSRSCIGDPQRIDRATALSLADNGWRRPTRAELLTLAFCSNNDPSYFPESRQGCSTIDDAPESPTIWQPVFPDAPDDANYQTSTECPSDSSATVSFSDGSSVTCASANQSTYLRQVRPQP